MQQTYIIKYSTGDEQTLTAYPPDFAKWERATSKSIAQFEGIWDLLFVAHSAYKREAAGKPTKPLEVWMESVIDFDRVADSPKAIAEEA